MAKYRKKPIVVEAEQHIGDPIAIETLERTMVARNGDFIITGVRGERYPCKEEIFWATYEPVQDKT